ncbi:MAG TPA: PAS domain-containing protein, partial [Steroidobacteraceae bacterium]|nr:PAS domain-containing protein [Steroidobacteraceae bacterium]
MNTSSRLEEQAQKERALLERFNIVTRAAGLSPWEFDLKANDFTWHGVRQECYGLDDVPLAQYLKALLAIVVEEDRHLLSSVGRNAFEKGIENYSYDFRVRSTDGKIHHMRNKCRLMRNIRGKFRYIMGVTMDVTNEVEANALLKQQATENQQLVARLNVATQAAGITPWEFDLKSNSFSWVGERPEVLGLKEVSPADYLAAYSAIVLPEDRHILVDAPAEAVAKGAEMCGYRYRAKGIDGSIHHLQSYARVMRSTHGRPYRLVGVTWDITQEVEATAALETQAQKERALTERLSVATQSAGISSWEIDMLAKKFLWIENPLQATSGSRDTSNSLDKFSERTHPDDRYAFRDATRVAAKEGRDIISYRYRYYREDGSLAHIQSHAKLYYNEQRRVVRTLGVSWDISKEVEAAEELQQRAEQERRLIERLNIATSAANIASWEIDLVAQRFLWLENPIRSQLRGNDNQLSLKEFAKFVLPEDRQKMPDAIREAVKNGSDRIGFRYRAYDADGRIIHLQSFSRLVVNEKGRPLRLLGVSWDVTPEVESAEKLRDAQLRFERAINGTQDGLWELDIAKNEAWCSPRLALLLGYPATQLGANNFL